MSKHKKVLVSVGKGDMRRPKQDYEELVTLFNGHGLGTLSDAQFFNEKIFTSPKNTDIYGFFDPRYSYSSASSLSEIVDLFNIGDHIHIVVADTLVKKPNVGAEFIEYGHSEDVPNLPFFIRGDLARSLVFEDCGEMFHKAIDSLVRSGKKIYHIASPLITAEFV